MELDQISGGISDKGALKYQKSRVRQPDHTKVPDIRGGFRRGEGEKFNLPRGVFPFAIR